MTPAMRKLGVGLFLLAALWAHASVQETEALRLAEGRRLAAGREMRTWSFAAFPAPRGARGPT